MSLFIDRTKRRADELRYDLATCRQFRHLDAEKRERAIKETYVLLAELWMGREAVKHPSTTILCTNCKAPRGRYAVGEGLCYRCYAVRSVEERDLWVEDVFEMAAGLFGFTCDACGDVSMPRIEAEKRVIAIRALENIEGAVKLLLCQTCTADFKSFASRNYWMGAWRTSPDREVEKMALAWLAQKVKVKAENYFR